MTTGKNKQGGWNQNRKGGNQAYSHKLPGAENQFLTFHPSVDLPANAIADVRKLEHYNMALKKVKHIKKLD